MLFRPLSELILCITCLDLFLCNLFISLPSLYGWDISAGEDQPNLAAHVLPGRHVHVEGHVSINDKRLSMYDDSGMITYSSLSLVWVNSSRNDSILALTRTGVKRDLL